MENGWQYLLKLKKYLVKGIVIPLLSIFPRKMVASIHKEKVWVLLVALSGRVQKLKTIQNSTNCWMDIACYIHILWKRKNNVLLHTHTHTFIYIMINKNNSDMKHIMHPSMQNISKDIVQHHYHESTRYN